MKLVMTVAICASCDVCGMSRRLFSLGLTLLLLSGCTFSVPLEPAVKLPTKPSQFAFAVGLYNSSEFHKYEYVEVYGGTYGTHGEGDHYVYPLGAASAGLFERLFAEIFEHVSPVSIRPSPSREGPPNVAGILEPAIEAFDVGIPVPSSSGLVWVEITYRMTLYSAHGEVVTSWTISGTGESPASHWARTSMREKAAELAMQDAATKFVLSLGWVPELRRWLRELQAVPSHSPKSTHVIRKADGDAP